MRYSAVLVMVALVVAGLCQPAAAEQVTVVMGGKRLSGWTTDDRKIYITNDTGRTIMVGHFNRTGAVEIYAISRDDDFVGQLNPMGTALLISPRTGDTMRIEMLR
jgi:hypothetical protein